MQAFLSVLCTGGLYFAGITLRVGRCTSQLAPPEARMPTARQSHEKRRRSTANRTFSPYHCILPSERRPPPAPMRPKTPKVCAITLTAHVAPKRALDLPGIMQTGNETDSPAQSYSAYFWTFSNRSTSNATPPSPWPSAAATIRTALRRASPLPRQPHIPRQPPKGQATPLS